MTAAVIEGAAYRIVNISCDIGRIRVTYGFAYDGYAAQIQV